MDGYQYAALAVVTIYGSVVATAAALMRHDKKKRDRNRQSRYKFSCLESGCTFQAEAEYESTRDAIAYDHARNHETPVKVGGGTCTASDLNQDGKIDSCTLDYMHVGNHVGSDYTWLDYACQNCGQAVEFNGTWWVKGTCNSVCTASPTGEHEGRLADDAIQPRVRVYEPIRRGRAKSAAAKSIMRQD